MHTDINDFLTTILSQLMNYGSIEVNNLKTLCYIIYQEKINNNSNKEIDALLTTILGCIDINTYVYQDIEYNYETNTDNILNILVNRNIYQTLGD